MILLAYSFKILYIITGVFFYKQWISRLMLTFKICMKTGYSPTVYFRQDMYGIYENKVLNTLITQLEYNELITDCEET